MANIAMDQKLWQRFCSGDPAVFEIIYREHAAHVTAFLRYYLADAQSAQDVTQDVFLALWQNPNGFNPARGNFRAYIYGIARKRAVDSWRRSNARLTSHPPLTTGDDLAITIGQALQQLEPAASALLWLREVEGYSHAELANILDIPVGTVKSRLSAARAALRCIWHTGRSAKPEKESV